MDDIPHDEKKELLMRLIATQPIKKPKRKTTTVPKVPGDVVGGD
jgi:hypothetical protein